jgi:hypothetical protein
MGNRKMEVPMKRNAFKVTVIVAAVAAIGVLASGCSGKEKKLAENQARYSGTWRYYSSQRQVESNYTITSDSFVYLGRSGTLMSGIDSFDGYTLSSVEWAAVKQEDVIAESRRNIVDYNNEGFSISGIVSESHSSLGMRNRDSAWSNFPVGTEVTRYVFMTKDDPSKMRISSADGAPTIITRQ